MRTVLASLAIAATTLPAGCGDDGNPKVPALVGQVQAAMRHVQSFHVSGFDVATDGTTVARGDWKAPGDLRLHLVIDGESADLIIVHGHPYVRGSAKFWRAQSMLPRLVATVADRWVIPPQNRQFIALARELRPESMAHCITVNLGSVRETSRVTRNGRTFRVLQLVGDKPGSSPGYVFVRAHGLPLIVRVQQTGPTKPGGVQDPLCDIDGSDNTRRSVTNLSRINKPVTITAPAHPLSLDDIRSQAKGTGTV